MVAKFTSPNSTGHKPTEAQTAVMHKRRLSASGEALYNGRLHRALYPAPFLLRGFNDSQNYKF